MDKMNIEEQLRSWKPRRPSPKIEQRLFGAVAARLPSRMDLWSWLTPLAVCALTVLVQAARQPVSPAGVANDTAFFATLMASSNEASYSLSRLDENVEWNVWPRASRPIQFASATDAPWSQGLTNGHNPP